MLDLKGFEQKFINEAFFNSKLMFQPQILDYHLHHSMQINFDSINDIFSNLDD